MIDKCPHCNGISGYYRKLVMAFHQHNDFEEKEENRYAATDAESCVIWGGIKAFCTDCNKEIKALKMKP